MCPKFEDESVSEKFLSDKFLSEIKFCKIRPSRPEKSVITDRKSWPLLGTNPAPATSPMLTSNTSASWNQFDELSSVVIY
jgi:hypothetical protein